MASKPETAEAITWHQRWHQTWHHGRQSARGNPTNAIVVFSSPFKANVCTHLSRPRIRSGAGHSGAGRNPVDGDRKTSIYHVCLGFSCRRPSRSPSPQPFWTPAFAGETVPLRCVHTLALKGRERSSCGCPAVGAEGAMRGAYNCRLSSRAGTVMEAEHINAVANRIADLAGRGEQLRRYL